MQPNACSIMIENLEYVYEIIICIHPQEKGITNVMSLHFYVFPATTTRNRSGKVNVRQKNI